MSFASVLACTHKEDYYCDGNNSQILFNVLDSSFWVIILTPAFPLLCFAQENFSPLASPGCLSISRALLQRRRARVMEYKIMRLQYRVDMAARPPPPGSERVI